MKRTVELVLKQYFEPKHNVVVALEGEFVGVVGDREDVTGFVKRNCSDCESGVFGIDEGKVRSTEPAMLVCRPEGKVANKYCAGRK